MEKQGKTRGSGGADRQVTSPLGQSSGYMTLCGICHLSRSTKYFELHGWESVYTKVANRGIYIYTMHEEGMVYFKSSKECLCTVDIGLLASLYLL